jgi:site-specific DNA-methyltransferase (adenine-specific)
MLSDWDAALVRKEVIGDATLYLGDCLEILPTLGKVDVVITDPPYSAVTHEGARGKGATTGGSHVLIDFASFSPQQWCSVVDKCLVLANRWVVAFADYRLALYANTLPLVRMGVWTKNDPAPQFSGDRPGTGWEAICIFHKNGMKRWNGGGRPAVWRTNIEKRGEHPTQKPIELMSALVSDFSDKGETILDPFMGSGTTGVACAQLGRKFIGIEIEERYFDIACRRIEDAYRQAPLFPEPVAKPEQEVLL